MVLTVLLFRFPWENYVVLRPRMPCAAQCMNLLRVARCTSTMNRYNLPGALPQKS